jgi:type VI secretion system protein ImpL
MKKIIAFLYTKQTAMITGLLVLIILLWLIGPLIAFGGVSPFASIGMRLTCTAMILALFLFFIQGWPMSILGVFALAILVWFAGPSFSFGNIQALASTWLRLLIITCLFLAYAVFGLQPLWQALGLQHPALGKFLLRGKRNDSALARDELNIVRGIILRAVAQLKHSRATAFGMKRLFEGRRYLYELPWYMIIGAPGAGKTTALINSGLKFPLMEQMHASAETHSHAGQGGTAHCAWWLSNQAVIIDTAGRYTSQEMDQQKDHAEWQGFLSILRKQRVRSPINGAILTISLAEILNQDHDARIANAARLQARLLELRHILGIRFPVYVMITKMDLLAGFSAYFHTMSQEELSQVWGFTLAYPEITDTKNIPAPLHETEASLALTRQIEEQLSLLTQRLEEGLNQRLLEENDTQRRQQIYALPHEFSSLAPALISMMDAIFANSRFDSTQIHTPFRGMYFTSAAQANISLSANKKTVLQRLRHAFLEKNPPDKRDHALPLPQHKRSYFLHHLFTKVIIRDAPLVRPNLRWESRLRISRVAMHVLAMSTFIWIAGALFISHDNNRAYLNTVSDRIPRIQSLINGAFMASHQPLPAQLSETLTAVQKLPQFQDLDLQQPSHLFGYGLFSAGPVVAANQSLYMHLQERLLMPILIRHLETRLAQAMQNNHPRDAYDALRIYLSLHSVSHYNAQSVRQWLDKNAIQDQGDTTSHQKTLISRHLMQLLASNKVLQSPFTQNIDLIEQVRAYLNTFPSTHYLYQQVMSVLRRVPIAPITSTMLFGNEAETLFTRASGKPLAEGIPGVFTRTGYQTLVEKRLPEFVAQASVEDAWVMGRELEPSVNTPENSLILHEIRRQYLQEYAQTWQQYLQDIRLKSASNSDFNLHIVRRLSEANSPLVHLVENAAHETSLTVDLSPSHSDNVVDRITNQLRRQFDQPTSQNTVDQQIHHELENTFSELHAFVAGNSDEEHQITLQTLLPLLAQFHAQLVQSRAALRTGTLPDQVMDSVTKLRLASVSSPAPLQQLLSDVVSINMRQLDESSAAYVRPQAQEAFNRIQAALTIVTNTCKASIAGRYPFANSQTDVLRDDFAHFFAHDGIADTFFQHHLAPYIDTQTSPWSYKNSADFVMQPDSSHQLAMQKELLRQLKASGPSPRTFEHIQTLRTNFFPDGGGKITSTASLQIVEMDPSIHELFINIDGQTQRYAHGPIQQQTIVFPGPRGGNIAEISALPERSASTLMTSGPWALQHLLDRARIYTPRPGQMMAEFRLDQRRAVLEIHAIRPITSDAFKGFSCPVSRQ